jgi:hypothetical protein
MTGRTVDELDTRAGLVVLGSMIAIHDQDG